MVFVGDFFLDVPSYPVILGLWNIKLCFIRILSFNNHLFYGKFFFGGGLICVCRFPLEWSMIRYYLFSVFDPATSPKSVRMEADCPGSRIHGVPKFGFYLLIDPIEINHSCIGKYNVRPMEIRHGGWIWPAFWCASFFARKARWWSEAEKWWKLLHAFARQKLLQEISNRTHWTDP